MRRNVCARACLLACARAYVRPSVRACVLACVRACVRACVCVCVGHSASNFSFRPQRLSLVFCGDCFFILGSCARCCFPVCSAHLASAKDTIPRPTNRCECEVECFSRDLAILIKRDAQSMVLSSLVFDCMSASLKEREYTEASIESSGECPETRVTEASAVC